MSGAKRRVADEALAQGLDLFASALLTREGWRRYRSLPGPGARGRARSRASRPSRRIEP